MNFNFLLANFFYGVFNKQEENFAIVLAKELRLRLITLVFFFIITT